MNVYEWVVQAYLQRRGLAFGRVRDSERVRQSAGPLKNFDYLVPDTPASTGALLEVKGRQFPTGGGSRWENWITQDDLQSLLIWERQFGARYRGLLVFAYQVRPGVVPGRAWTPAAVEQKRFGLVACPVAEYAAHARVRSRKWATLSVAKGRFKSLIRPLAAWV